MTGTIAENLGDVRAAWDTDLAERRLFNSASDSLSELVRDACRECLAICESPIEAILLKSLFLFHRVWRGQWPIIGNLPAIISAWHGSAWHISQQVKIADFRVDFVIKFITVDQQIVIECDGHDYHERTKEQAAKDRSRDRALTAMGYRVIRFTGSEIWADPWRCARDVLAQNMNAMGLKNVA